MQKPLRDSDVSDAAPTELVVTGYDEVHLITYISLLDAAAEGVD